MSSDTDIEKKLIRKVLRRVHPDLFRPHTESFAQATNQDSLRILNTYLDGNGSDKNTDVEFFVRDGASLVSIQATLPARQKSIGPLLFAFGLITNEQLDNGFGRFSVAEREGRTKVDSSNVQFFDWLSKTVKEAVKTSKRHDALKMRIRELRTYLEEFYGFDSIRTSSSGDFGAGTSELTRQLESLKTLDIGLQMACKDDMKRFSGLRIRIYHPDTAPSSPGSAPTTAKRKKNQGEMQPFIGPDGCIHIVASYSSIHPSLSSIDLSRARVLTDASAYWSRRFRELLPPLCELLRVPHVWNDAEGGAETEGEVSSQKFVLWSGSMLRDRDLFRDLQVGVGEDGEQAATFGFSILVHHDSSAPMIDFLRQSSILQVRSDCSAAALVEFLSSEAAAQANDSAESSMKEREEEEILLETCRQALGARHVIRVLSLPDPSLVTDAANRLIQAAPFLRPYIDLSNASIAIDDCYELWDSGFVSIPYDFSMDELTPQLSKLLSSRSSASVDESTEPETLDEYASPLSFTGPNGRQFLVVDENAMVSLDDNEFEDGGDARGPVVNQAMGEETRVRSRAPPSSSTPMVTTAQLIAAMKAENGMGEFEGLGSGRGMYGDASSLQSPASGISKRGRKTQPPLAMMRIKAPLVMSIKPPRAMYRGLIWFK